MGHSLSGKRILIVEDECLIAADLARALEEEGAEILGPFCESSPALSSARDNHVDVALLDVNLNGGHCYSVAELLEDRAVPLIFITGYDPSALAERFRSAPTITKPFHMDAVLSEMVRLARGSGIESDKADFRNLG